MSRIPPFFIVGAGRSGTTLLGLMLDGHSKVAIPYESHFIIHYYHRIAEYGDLSRGENRERLMRAILAEPFVSRWDQKISLADLDLDACGNLGAAVNQLFTAYATKHCKPCWGAKDPAYTAHVDVIHKLIPDAKYVHIVRDGRDVALSLMKTSWGPHRYLPALDYWVRTVVSGRKLLATLPDDRWMQLRYEDLVAQPEQELNKVTSFLGLTFEKQMVDGYMEGASQKVGEIINFHHQHLTEPPSVRQAYKWKTGLREVDQALTYKIAGPLLEELGYPTGVTRHPLTTARRAYHLLHDAVAWRVGRMRRARQGRRRKSPTT